MIYDITVINDILKNISIPKMIKVRQVFERDRVEDISFAINKTLSQEKILSTIKPGMRIAITCGSRGISNISLIIKEIVNFTQKMGGKPFIVTAMGSHGGATVEGQKKILQGMGVTEEYCGCPIISSLETSEIGITAEGESIYLDKNAASADGIILIGRIKPHTDFQARYESGLMKMMAVGLGKQKGAEIVHKKGVDDLGSRIEVFGTHVLENAPILFGIGIVENAYDETKIIEALSRNEIKFIEPKLLDEAYKSMPRILFEDIDLLIVDEIGKEISGTGADPNVTGSFATNCIKKGITRPSKIIFLDLTKATDGSAVGIGLCDITTMSLFEKIDFAKTYVNSITCNVLKGSTIPVIMENDYQAIRLGVYLSNCVDVKNLKIVRIKNTMNIKEIYISEGLLNEAVRNQRVNILDEACDMRFDEKGNLVKF